VSRADLAPWAALEASPAAAAPPPTTSEDADLDDATAGPPPAASRPATAATVRRPQDFRWTVVPHTHWDREWYRPFEVFRIRLARMIDEAVEAMERDPRLARFTLDGQAVILEDYAELRSPARVERLLALVRAGRIVVGPAYVLPDEFLAGPESLVRTWLVGGAVCAEFGVRPMAVGYLPDEFGHVTSLPTILAGFGIEDVLFWRGGGDEADRLGAVFEWLGPDGSSVLAVRLLAGYGGAAELGRWADSGVSVHEDPARWPQAAAHRFVRYLARHGDVLDRSGIRATCLPNGADHLPLQTDVPALLDHARSAHPGLEVSIGGWEDYLADLRRDVPGPPELPVWRGEFVSGRDVNVLRGVDSARMYLKQAAEKTERALLVAETLSTLACAPLPQPLRPL
jgi:mannosylglycerate hydrolase